MKVPLVLPSPVQQHLRRFSENFTRCLHDELCEELKDVIIPQPKTQSYIGIRKGVGGKGKRTHDPIMRFQELFADPIGSVGADPDDDQTAVGVGNTLVIP